MDGCSVAAKIIIRIFDTVHESFAVHVFYFYLVESINNPTAGNDPIW